MVRETRPDDIGISVSYPLPGTRFHQNVFTQIGPRANWSDSADLAMVFQGAYPSEFYRALADALHLEVRGGNHVGGERLDAAWERVHSLERTPSLAEAVA
jgi:anaerobic magnesium-protoporphyrin IX monomethyl ester cyclase